MWIIVSVLQNLFVRPKQIIVLFPANQQEKKSTVSRQGIYFIFQKHFTLHELMAKLSRFLPYLIKTGHIMIKVGVTKTTESVE